MPRAYTKAEMLSEEVFRRKAAGETNREIAESYGLTLNKIKKLVTRQNNKVKKIANGYVPRPTVVKHTAPPKRNIVNFICETYSHFELI